MPAGLPSLPADTPVLSGRRVQLRPFREPDVAVVLEVADDPLIPLITTVPSHVDGASGTAEARRDMFMYSRLCPTDST